jgi:hypothetical protein
MYIINNVHLINMENFYFEVVQFQQSLTDIIKILEKVLFWYQKWIFKNLGQFYFETVNIKVVDNT